MSDGPINPEELQGGEDSDENDMGEPIAELAEFDADAPSSLVARIRRTIHRRSTMVQLLTFSWTAPPAVLKEFWLMVIEQTNPQKSGKDGREG